MLVPHERKSVAVVGDEAWWTVTCRDKGWHSNSFHQFYIELSFSLHLVTQRLAEGGCMRQRIIWCLVPCLIFAMATLVLSLTVTAATMEIAPQEEFTKTLALHKGEAVDWSWTAQELDLEFSIEDPEGDIAYSASNKATDSGTFVTTLTEDWKFSWQNDKEYSPSYDYTITLDYTITVLNRPPIVQIAASVTSGIVPLSVTLNGSGTDPDGSVVSYSWDLGTEGPPRP